ERGEAIAKSRKADRPHAPIVRAGALDDHAEARIHQPGDEIDGDDQQRQAEVVELGAVGEVEEAGELAAPTDGQAVVGAIAVEPDAEVIDELSEGERDHDEI